MSTKMGRSSKASPAPLPVPRQGIDTCPAHSSKGEPNFYFVLVERCGRVQAVNLSPSMRFMGPFYLSFRVERLSGSGAKAGTKRKPGPRHGEAHRFACSLRCMRPYEHRSVLPQHGHVRTSFPSIVSRSLSSVDSATLIRVPEASNVTVSVWFLRTAPCRLARGPSTSASGHEHRPTCALRSRKTRMSRYCFHP